MFVVVLMFFTATPFNDEIQGLALASGAGPLIIIFAGVFPLLWIGLMFIVLAFTGYEVYGSLE
jgi:hypothetical protein